MIGYTALEQEQTSAVKTTRVKHRLCGSIDTWAGQIEGSVMGTFGDDDTLVELWMLLVCLRNHNTVLSILLFGTNHLITRFVSMPVFPPGMQIPHKGVIVQLF